VGRVKGSWVCVTCRKLQRPGTKACAHCGADRPRKRSSATRGQRGALPKPSTRSAAARKREKDSGLSSEELKRSKASDSERTRRRARGRSLANSPLALEIEQAVWGRYNEDYEKRRNGGEQFPSESDGN
jgi:hypothetical protein